MRRYLSVVFVLWCLTVMSDQWYEWPLLTGRVRVSSWKGITRVLAVFYIWACFSFIMGTK